MFEKYERLLNDTASELAENFYVEVNLVKAKLSMPGPLSLLRLKENKSPCCRNNQNLMPIHAVHSCKMILIHRAKREKKHIFILTYILLH